MCRRAFFIAGKVFLAAATGSGQFSNVFSGSTDHPAIRYQTHPVTDPVSELNRRLHDGSVKLQFKPGRGYLASVLSALNILPESQMAVFSKTSRLAPMISPHNPRAIYFNDQVVVASVRGSLTLEIAAQDPRQGIIFYTLVQQPAASPHFERSNSCLTCHESQESLGIPGMLLRSVFPDSDGLPRRELGEFLNDHRSPLSERWGGWFVTGTSPSSHDMGTHIGALDPRLETLTPDSDVVALMVFDHQARMMNLLTRAGWEARFAAYEKQPMDQAVVKELVDYLLFLDEAPLPGKLKGSSAFAKKFAAAGPLREFDLKSRMMKYPCSYMLYSAAFEGLPVEAKDAIYKRMWRILSGAEPSRLSATDRTAVIEILRETKRDLPDCFL